MTKIRYFFEKTLQYISKTKIGKLLTSLVLAGTSFAISGIYSFMSYIGLAFMIYPVGLVLTMITYAWIINPIRNWKLSKTTVEIQPEVNIENDVVAYEKIDTPTTPIASIKKNKSDVKTSPKKTTKKSSTKKKTTHKNEKRKK